LIAAIRRFFQARRDADYWRILYAQEIEARIAAEVRANAQAKHIAVLRAELAEARHDLSNARKLLGYRRDVVNAGMN
jgi:hypothetical protein